MRPTTEYHDEVLKQIQDIAKVSGMAVPSRAFEQLQPRILDYVPRKFLTCTYIAEERYGNPMRQLYGSYVSMAFELTFAMFGLLTAERPCATLTLDSNFIRPVPANSSLFTVQVRLRALNRSVLFLEAVASNSEDKTVATAMTTMNVTRHP